MDNETIVLKLQAGQGNRKQLLEMLWIQNLGLIRKIIHGLTGLERNKDSDKQDFEDLEQQAFLGILQAIPVYDSEKGTKFFTIAHHYITVSVYRYYDKYGQSIRIPDYMRHRIRVYTRERERQLAQGLPVTDESIKKALGWTDNSFRSVISAMKKMKPERLDSLLDENDRDSGTVLDMIAGSENVSETALARIIRKGSTRPAPVRPPGITPEGKNCDPCPALPENGYRLDCESPPLFPSVCFSACTISLQENPDREIWAGTFNFPARTIHKPGMQENTGRFSRSERPGKGTASLIPCTLLAPEPEKGKILGIDIDQNRLPAILAYARTPEPQELNELLDRAISYVIREITAGYEKELQEKREQAIRIYECQKDFIRALLEHYRDSPKNSPVRETVNSLIRSHRDCNDQTDRYKVSHNVIVLRYIVQNPLAEKEICKRLLISQRYLQNSTERAIMDLCVLFLGWTV